MSTVPFRVPTGQGQQQQDPPDSLIAQLRARAAEKQAKGEVTIPLHGLWEGRLRVTYGYVDLDTLEGYADVDLTHVSNIGMTLDMLGKACKRIEGCDQETGEWATLEDAHGAVGFDDRLARLLGFPRPDDDWEFSTRQVYELVFEGNGLAIGAHVTQAATWMGIVNQEEESGKTSTSGGSTPAPPPPPSA